MSKRKKIFLCMKLKEKIRTILISIFTFFSTKIIFVSDPSLVREESYTLLAGSNLTLPCLEAQEVEGRGIHTLSWYCRYTPCTNLTLPRRRRGGGAYTPSAGIAGTGPVRTVPENFTPSHPLEKNSFTLGHDLVTLCFLRYSFHKLILLLLCCKGFSI